MFSFLLALTACTTEKDLPTTDKFGKDITFLKEEAHKNAQAQWDAYIQETGYKHPEGDGLLTGCNCGYEILNVQYQVTPEFPNLEIGFNSNLECSPFCKIFSGLFFSENDCINPNDPLLCVDLWTGLPPIGAFQFNCETPEYSQFPATLQSYALTTDCTDGDWTFASITFRIVCTETCDGGYSYPSYSDPFTLVFDPNNAAGPYNGNESTVIALSGCGCKPVLTE